eukprot:3749606-Rhodomonas_salina.1
MDGRMSDEAEEARHDEGGSSDLQPMSSQPIFLNFSYASLPCTVVSAPHMALRAWRQRRPTAHRKGAFVCC